MLLALAAWVVSLIALGLLAYIAGEAVGQGSVSLAAFLATWLSMSTVAVVMGRSTTGRGFTFVVPPGCQAIVSESGQFSVAPATQRQWLIPWYDKVQALVPTRDFVVNLPEKRVELGASGSTNGSVAVSVQVHYVAQNAVVAYTFFEREAASGGKKKGIVGEKDLKRKWDQQLAADLTPILTNQLWGATLAECVSNRSQIQDHLHQALAGQAARWGIHVIDLTILSFRGR
jgi:hypothetical protein